MNIESETRQQRFAYLILRKTSECRVVICASRPGGNLRPGEFRVIGYSRLENVEDFLFDLGGWFGVRVVFVQHALCHLCKILHAELAVRVDHYI